MSIHQPMPTSNQGPTPNSRGSLTGRFDPVDPLRPRWTSARGSQKLAYAVGTLLVASGAFHLGLLVATGDPWAGPMSWRKPFTFGVSFGLVVLTVAWTTTYLPSWRGMTGAALTALAAASLVEVALATAQRWRGVPSHFNYATAFDEAVWTAMGMTIGVVVAALVLLTIAAFVSMRASPSLRWAIRLGLVGLLAGQAFGGLIVANADAFAEPDRPANAATFGPAGDMKLSHAVWLHTAQIVPALGVLVGFTAWRERRRLAVVLLGAAGYATLCVAVTARTFVGRPPLSSGPLLAAGVVGLVVVGLAYADALRALRGREAAGG